MKHKRIFRILAVALTLALLVLTMPASQVMALAESINVDPDEGTIGDPLNITGTGTLQVEYNIYFSSQNADINDDIDTHVTAYEWLTSVKAGGMEGTFSTMGLKVPSRLTDGDDVEDVHGGIYYIYLTRYTDVYKNIKAKTTFLVTGIAEITTFDPNEGTVGTEVEISGEGFAPGEAIIVEYDGDEINIDSGDDEADTNGEFTLFILVPESTYGEHTITVIGEDSLAELELVFTVEPAMTISPEEGEVGTLVTVTGTGFARRNGVDFYFGASPIAVVWLVESGGRTNSDGTFAVTMVVPEVAPGNYTVLAEDEDDNDISAQRTFAVTVPPLNPEIDLSADSGNVGDEVTVSGKEFSPDDTVTIYFDLATIDEPIDLITIGTVPTGSDGSFSSTFNIPDSTGGIHWIYVEDSVGLWDGDFITVEPEMTVTPLTGVMGDNIAVSGTGFGAGEDITILYGTAVITPTAPITTDPDGSFIGSFDVPAVPGGSYTVTVTDGTNSLTTGFVVGTGVIINPTSGEVGDGVGVGGYGFGANKTITILFNNTSVSLVAPITTGDSGTFSGGGFYVPASPAGSYTVEVSDGTNSDSANFTVVIDITISQITSEVSPGYVGMELTISGTGFKANATVTVTYESDPEVLKTTTTDSSGSFSVTFTIPKSVGVDHTITVSDGETAEQFVFVMESILPQSPVPLLPPMDFKPKQPVQFDWDWADANEHSLPVTYTLQIATDENFTDPLEWTRTESEYTMTEEEELESRGAKEPYYWRVNAIDSAGNISDWSDADSFYIGGGWPGWLIWLLIGLGAVVVGIFAFWLGRRFAYASY